MLVEAEQSRHNNRKILVLFALNSVGLLGRKTRLYVLVKKIKNILGAYERTLFYSTYSKLTLFLPRISCESMYLCATITVMQPCKFFQKKRIHFKFQTYFKKAYRQWPKAWQLLMLVSYSLCRDRVVHIVVQTILTTIRCLQLMTLRHIPPLLKRLTDLPDQSEHRIRATLLTLAMSELLWRAILFMPPKNQDV